MVEILRYAIADVAAYVRPGTALDREAYLRGNSVYFPDRVVPMLPERISNDLCSLRAREPRPALALRMIIGADGRKRRHTFHRVLMRSAAKLGLRSWYWLRAGERFTSGLRSCAPAEPVASLGARGINKVASTASEPLYAPEDFCRKDQRRRRERPRASDPRAVEPENHSLNCRVARPCSSIGRAADS